MSALVKVEKRRMCHVNSLTEAILGGNISHRSGTGTEISDSEVQSNRRTHTAPALHSYAQLA